MLPKLIKLPSVNTVGQGQTAQLVCPTTDVYHAIQFEIFINGVAATQAVIEANILRLRMKINGKTQREFKPSYLFKMQAEHNITVTDGYLTIWLGKPDSRDAQGEDALAWGTADVENFQIELDQATPIVGGITISASALVEDGANRNIGVIEQWTTVTVPVSAIGAVDYNPNIEPLHSYYGMECFSADITAIEVKRDGVTKFDASPAQFNALYKDKGLIPQAGLTSVLWDHSRRVSDSMPVAFADGSKTRNFAVRFTMGAANSFEVLHRRLGVPA